MRFVLSYLERDMSVTWNCEIRPESLAFLRPLLWLEIFSLDGNANSWVVDRRGKENGAAGGEGQAKRTELRRVLSSTQGRSRGM